MLKSNFIKRNLFNLKYFKFTEKINFPQYELVKLSQPADRVGLITLNRPKAKNALNNQINSELNSALFFLEENKEIATIVLTGDKEFLQLVQILKK